MFSKGHIQRSDWAHVGHPQAEGGEAPCVYHPAALLCHYRGVEEDARNNLCSFGEFHAQED